MADLIVKICLGVLAFVVAILEASDREKPQVDPLPAHRISRRFSVRFFKILCALAILPLAIVNEYFSYQSERTAESKIETLQSQLHDAKLAVDTETLRLLSLIRTNNYLVTSLDSSLVRAGYARVPSENIEDPQYDLHFESGEPFIPKNGDIFEWEFYCDDGHLPDVPATSLATCSPTDYGRLIANGFSMPLDSKSGRRVFFGSRSHTEAVSYASPLATMACPSLAKSMSDAKCNLEVLVMREARWKFEQLNKEKKSVELIPSGAEDDCRQYQAIFGESCADLLKQGGDRSQASQKPHDQ